VERSDRIARNEILFRQVNERILQIEGGWRVDPVDFMCECGDVNCTRVVQLAVDDYEGLRADPTHFAVLPGHELPEIELVVERYPHYVVVEKTGTLREQAREADPRA